MPAIHIISGTQGAGKTTYAKALAEKVNGVHLSIDEWMWTLFGADLPSPVDMPWLMQRVGRCEKQIWNTTLQVYNCGTNVILDLGFMKVSDRERLLNKAADLGMQTQLHFINADYQTRLQRVMQRNVQKGNTFSFEVSPVAFNYMEQQFEQPTESELRNALVIDTGAN